MSDMVRNAVRQARRFWISALVIVLGAALGVAAVVFTLGAALDVALRTVAAPPADQDRTLAFHLVEGRATTDQLYDALHGLPDLAAVVMSQIYNLGTAEGVGVATSQMARTPIWHPPLVAGRYLEPADSQSGAEAVAVIGQALAARWFGGREAIGQSLDLGLGQPVRVVGLLGVRGRLTRWDQEIVVPGPLDTGRIVSRFEVKAVSPAAVPALRQAVLDTLQRRAPGVRVAEGLEVVTADERAERRALAAVSVLALLVVAVSGINCGNLAAFWVLRRRREIGIRQALGATPGHVIRMILAEVLLLHLAGALLGLGLYAAGFYLWQGRVLVEVGHVSAALLTALLSGLLAGAAPAVMAARMDPAEAMKAQ